MATTAQPVLDVVWPAANEPLTSYDAALEHALNSPLGAPKLESMVSPGSTVAIIVDDPSRWTPISAVLGVVLRRLHASGVRSEDVTISVGVGRHHQVSSDAMSQRLGPEIAARYRCFSPPVDDLAAYVDLGRTSQGIPVRVFRPVAEADLRVLVGSVLPHLQAGFGGGLKLIFPGTSHRSTLGALHRQGLDQASDPARLIGGHASVNPMRQAIHEAANQLGPCWSISHLAGGPNEIFYVLAGNPLQVQDKLTEHARSCFQAPPSAPVDVIVVGNHPWPGDPMQSFKVLLHHQAACRRGGLLVGLFWTNPAEIDRSFPLSSLRLIARSGTVGATAIRGLLPLAHNAARAVRSPTAFMLRWAYELVIDRSVLVYAPPLYERLGTRLGPVRLFGDQDCLWQAVTTNLRQTCQARGPARIRVFPRGGLTYVAPNVASSQ
jgi:lactate racemase